MDEADPSYQPPPPFAPPSDRLAPLNEWQMLGRTTYPAQQPYPVAAQYPPVAWHPAAQWSVSGDPQAAQYVRAAAARRRTRLVGAAVLATLLAVVGALLIGEARARPHSLTVPDSAAGYSRLSSVTTSQLQSLFGTSGAFGALPPEDLQHAKVGVYGHDATALPSLIFVGFDAASPTISQQLHSEAAAQVTSDVLAGAGTTLAPLAVDAGPLGGSLKCGTVEMDGIDASVGVWADSDTLGLVLLFDPTLSPSREQTGSVVRSFRGAAEN